MAARIGVAIVAALVLAWLGVMERDARLLARGIEAAGGAGRPADLPRAEAAFRSARLLNPDTRPDVLRAAIQSRRGRHAEAVAALEAVVRREPDNLGAWSVLSSVGKDDPAIVGRALAARARLDPVNARRR
jgi:predicted Zn-dependent protease